MELLKEELEENSSLMDRSSYVCIDYLLNDGEYEEAFFLLMDCYIKLGIDTKKIRKDLLIDIAKQCKNFTDAVDPDFYKKLEKYCAT